MLHDMTTLEKACRLIRAATGEDYGDCETVSDVLVGYAEPGYGSSDSVIVLGNWNQKGGWENPNPTKAQTMPVRLGNALESIGVECEWSDEWDGCVECNRAMRIQPNSYCWVMYGAFYPDGYVCQDCMLIDPEVYLEDYINNSDNACTWIDSAGLMVLGYVQWAPDDPQTYENGWHPGQTDDPARIMARIHAEHPDADVVFVVDSVEQFSMQFSAYVKGLNVGARGAGIMSSISSNHFSVDQQMADALNYLKWEHPEDYADVISEFPETFIWEGSWLDAEAMGVDLDYSSWVIEAIEETGHVFWEEGEPWAI